VRSLLEDLPAHSNPVVVLRASRARDLVHAGEIEDLAYARGGRVHRLVGPRDRVRLDAAALTRLVPDIADRDVYVCGPGGMADQAVRAALAAGVPAERVHNETFDA
jgi:ferredoxin-NADP reductase